MYKENHHKVISDRSANVAHSNYSYLHVFSLRLDIHALSPRQGGWRSGRVLRNILWLQVGTAGDEVTIVRLYLQRAES